MNIVKKIHEVTVNTTTLLHILRKLTIRKLDLWSWDPSQLCLAIRTYDHPKTQKKTSKWRETCDGRQQGRSTYPPQPGAMGGPYLWLDVLFRTSSSGPLVCSWPTPYMADWRRNWRLLLCDFTSGSTITSACFVFAGNLINPSRLSACTWLWGDVFNEEIPHQGDFLDFIFLFLTWHFDELTVGL